MADQRSIFERFTVVNAQAGVWRCDACGAHVPSPAEHECEDWSVWWSEEDGEPPVTKDGGK